MIVLYALLKAEKSSNPVRKDLTKGRKNLRDMKTDLNMQKNNDSRAEQGSSTARTRSVQQRLTA
ncbi:hypothetical protein JCM6294_1047 [Bacteroides pyogenes DSM 20611 = JCM 6294]|uniref:Uncharacterized protein n=1 Tax=Bacteroides pyogenes DSM 20611 = JCM 6294 TaxID=1121100 RepID=W4PED9_9BACE|nr:hypothetical protein JCM6294_1047 [Bacteroides pyogenes DSM 20611 = JCM 6294]